MGFSKWGFTIQVLRVFNTKGLLRLCGNLQKIHSIFRVYLIR